MCIHHFELIRDTGYHVYLQCARCEHRKISVHTHDEAHPSDQQWIESGVFAADQPAPIHH